MSTAGYALLNDHNVQAVISQRAAHKEAAFVLHHLQLDSCILDVGCGPGSITCDFAALVPRGHVVGVDIDPAVVDSARQRGRRMGLNNIEFRVGNIVDGMTDLPDGKFDIVFCHQLLTHASDPVAAMREMRRLVNRKTGVVAAREFLTILWYPTNPVLEGLTQWLARAFRAASGADKFVEETLPHIWARGAGFDEDCIVNGSSGVGTNTRRQRETSFETLQGMMAEGTSLRESMIKAGATQKDFDAIMEALEVWRDNADGWNMWLSSEIICRCEPES